MIAPITFYLIWIDERCVAYAFRSVQINASLEIIYRLALPMNSSCWSSDVSPANRSFLCDEGILRHTVSPKTVREQVTINYDGSN